MTWEYDNPSASSKDAVRFLIGDTDDNDHQLEDEEIDYLVTRYGDADAAAVAGARALASKYARLAVSEKDVGDLKIVYRDRSQGYYDLAAALLKQSGGSTLRPRPVATGITQSGRDDAEANDDRLAEQFDVGMDDIPSGWPPASSTRVAQP
jgi:hypothetical protein